MAKIGIFYASGKGDTKKACEYLAGKIGGELIAVKEANGEDFEKYDVLILASPSYDFAELHGDWKAKLGALKSASLSGKLVALVGVGNQERHPDSFRRRYRRLPSLRKGRAASRPKRERRIRL